MLFSKHVTMDSNVTATQYMDDILVEIQLLSQEGSRTAQTITQLQQVQAVRSAIQHNLLKKAILLGTLVAIERNPGGSTSAKHYALLDLLAQHNIPEDLIPELRLSDLYNAPLHKAYRLAFERM